MSRSKKFNIREWNEKHLYETPKMDEKPALAKNANEPKAKTKS